MLNSTEHKIIQLINVKMPTMVGILTFISMINTTSERLKARNFFISRYFSFYEQLKFRAMLSTTTISVIMSVQWGPLLQVYRAHTKCPLSMKKFYNLGA